MIRTATVWSWKADAVAVLLSLVDDEIMSKIVKRCMGKSMKDKFAVSMFGQKRLSREGGIEIVVKELSTRMVRDGCQVTCYNRSGHHVSGAEYDNKIEYDGIRQKFVPTIERKGARDIIGSTKKNYDN